MSDEYILNGKIARFVRSLFTPPEPVLETETTIASQYEKDGIVYTTYK